MRSESKHTAIVLLAVVCLIGLASAWASQPADPIFEPTGQWRVTPLNNGGYVIEGDLPEFTMPEPTPEPMYAFAGIDREGNEQGHTSIPITNLLSVAAEAWPVYDADRENVVAIRYGSAIRYGDGRWAWVDREYHEVVGELVALGWASGDVPARWTHPLDGSLPVAAGAWK